MQLRRRRVLLVGTLAGALVAVGVVVFVGLRSDHEASPVPTVPVANTPTNIGCIDEAGTVSAPIDGWYSNDADGSLQLTGELTASAGLGAFSAAATKALVANVGRFTTSAVRDIAPTPTACVTLRYARFELDGGAQIEVMAWRVVSQTSPMWVPNEAAFVRFDDRTLVSRGNHIVSTLTVAPDGTTVLVSAFGSGARELLTRNDATATSATDAPDPGPAPATAEQVAAIGQAVMEQVIQR